MAIGHARWTNLESYVGDTWKVRSNVTLELGLRYSILYEPYDALNKITGFSPAQYNPARPASDPCNGLIVPKGLGNPCSGIAGASVPVEFKNRSLRDNNYKNFAPRLGVAWDIFGNGKTAFACRSGTVFLRERTSPVFAAMTQNPPFVKSVGGQRTLDGSVFSSWSLSASAGSRSSRLTRGPRRHIRGSLMFSSITSCGKIPYWRLAMSATGPRPADQL